MPIHRQSFVPATPSGKIGDILPEGEGKSPTRLRVMRYSITPSVSPSIQACNEVIDDRLSHTRPGIKIK